MDSLDVTKEGTSRLAWKITHLAKKCKELPEKLIITMEQYELLHKHIEVWGGNDEIPAEFIYNGKYNVMEVEVKDYTN